MANLTEQLEEDAKQKTKDAAKIAVQSGKTLNKGIALILNGTILSEESIMKALDRKVEKTGDLNYSYAKVSMEELQRSSKVERIEEPLLKEAMGYFDRYCREYGVKYSALKTEPKGENSKEQEGYIIFFEGKNDKVIDHIIKNAVTDWQADQERMKREGKDIGKETAEEKPSVLAKLAFFRNRVKEHVEQDKSAQKSNDKIRTPDLER